MLASGQSVARRGNRPLFNRMIGDVRSAVAAEGALYLISPGRDARCQGAKCRVYDFLMTTLGFF